MSFLIWVIKNPTYDISQKLKTLNVDFLIKDFIQGEQLLAFKFEKLHIKDLIDIENIIEKWEPILILDIKDEEVRKFLKAS